MIMIWWPGFIASVVYLAAGLLHLPKRFPRYEKYDEARKEFAKEQSWRYFWQFGLLFAALCFMLMRSTIRMAVLGQEIILGVLIVVEIAAVLFLYIPVEHAVEEKFGEGE